MNKDMAEKYQSLKRDLEKVGQDIAEFSSLASNEVSKHGQQSMAAAEETIDNALKMVKDKGKEADKYAHENPWLIAGVLSGVSFLVGLVSAKCRHKSE